MRIAAGRTVAFHGINGVDNRYIRFYRLGKFHKHAGKILEVWKTVVHLRFFQTGNHPEKILDAAGVAGHGMGFQLADIDDVVCLADGRYDVKGMILKTCRTVYGFGAKVHV